MGRGSSKIREEAGPAWCETQATRTVSLLRAATQRQQQEWSGPAFLSLSPCPTLTFLHTIGRHFPDALVTFSAFRNNGPVQRRPNCPSGASVLPSGPAGQITHALHFTDHTTEAPARGIAGPTLSPSEGLPAPSASTRGRGRGFLEPLSHLVVTWAWKVLKALVAGEEEDSVEGVAGAQLPRPLQSQPLLRTHRLQ